MKDLTSGSIPGHIGTMSVQMAIPIFVQTLYFFTDLYFVTKLGDAVTAGVTSAGNLWFVTLALTQILNVGTLALVAQAVGAKDRERANLVFNQALMLSLFLVVIVIVGLYVFSGPYMRAVAADAETARAGMDYLHWFAPGLGLQFIMIAMFATLRGTGIVMPTMIIQMLSLVVNIGLAPVLIAGWGTGRPLGAAGAGLASTIAVTVGVILCAYYFFKHEKYVAIHRGQMRPRTAVWSKVLAVGLPVGLEFILISIVMTIIYYLIRDFGAAAQAGFGVSQSVMRIIMLPAMAVAFAAAPIAGQNFGARRPERVHETFRWAALLSIVIMTGLTIVCQFEAEWFMHWFTREEAVVAVGVEVLVITSWNFVATGVIFSCSSIFQGLGNTWPVSGASAFRLVLFVVPAFWLTSRPGFTLDELWYLSVATMFLQAVASYLLLRREFARKLNGDIPRFLAKGDRPDPPAERGSNEV